VRGIDIWRPLIAAGIKKAGRFISQQDLHKSKKGLLPGTGQQHHHHEIRSLSPIP